MIDDQKEAIVRRIARIQGYIRDLRNDSRKIHKKIMSPSVKSVALRAWSNDSEISYIEKLTKKSDDIDRMIREEEKLITELWREHDNLGKVIKESSNNIKKRSNKDFSHDGRSKVNIEYQPKSHNDTTLNTNSLYLSSCQKENHVGFFAIKNLLIIVIGLLILTICVDIF